MAAIMAAIMEITENIMRRMREPSTKLHNALYFMSGMMVVILALVIVAGVKTKAENAGFHITDDTENSLHKQGHTVVLITHDNSIAVQADRIIRLEDGQVVYDGDSHAPEAMVQPTLLPETPEKEEQA